MIIKVGKLGGTKIDIVWYKRFDRRTKESQVVMEYLSAFIKEAVDGGVYSNEYREI